jgi:hypothetical protein
MGNNCEGVGVDQLNLDLAKTEQATDFLKAVENIRTIIPPLRKNPTVTVPAICSP